MTGEARPRSGRPLAPAASVAAALVVTLLALALLVAVPHAISIGWIVIVLATLFLPSIGLARLLSLPGGPVSRSLLGLPLAFGAQFLPFALAATFHWQPTHWGIAAVLLGFALFVAGMRRVDENGSPYEMTPVLALTLGLLLLVGSALVAVSGRDSDDWAYGAQVADYAADTPLAAHDPVLGTDIPMLPRQRLNMWLAELGLTARASSIDVPTLLQDHLPAAAALIALAATYLLGTAVGGRPAWGVVAVAAQLVWFVSTPQWSWPGDAFLARITQDKVMVWMVLLPLLLVPLVQNRWTSPMKAATFGVLGGLGLAAVHPVSQAFGIVPFGIWAASATIGRLPGARNIWLAAAGYGIGISITVVSLVGFASLGPSPGSPAAVELELAQVKITAAQLVFSKDLPAVVLNPVFVANPLTLTAGVLALLAPLVRYASGTTLVASLLLTTVFLALNPIVTPIVASVLSDAYGLGLLLRLVWILPVPYALPALAGAYEQRLGLRLPFAPLAALVLVVAMQLPSLPAAYRQWDQRRLGHWRDEAEMRDIYGALLQRSDVDDVVLAPKRAEFRIPSQVPQVKLLAFQGSLGTWPHFPTYRVDEAMARDRAVGDFYTKRTGVFTERDLATLRDWHVRFLVLDKKDARYGEAKALPWLVLVVDGSRALFEVTPGVL